jgi:hypothetical protein
VVVVLGVTVAQSFAFRLVPTPGVMLIDEALVTCQQSFVEVPGLMFGGLATKLTTCGIALPLTPLSSPAP